MILQNINTAANMALGKKLADKTQHQLLFGYSAAAISLTL
jgi:hypothetical protein